MQQNKPEFARGGFNRIYSPDVALHKFTQKAGRSLSYVHGKELFTIG